MGLRPGTLSVSAGDTSSGGSQSRAANRTDRGRAPQLPHRTLRGTNAPSGEIRDQSLSRSRGGSNTNSLHGAQHPIRIPGSPAGLGGVPRMPKGSNGALSSTPPGESASAFNASTAGPQERIGAGSLENPRGPGESSSETTGATGTASCGTTASGASLTDLYTGPVTFDRMRVALAGDTHDIPLGGGSGGTDQPVTAAGDNPQFVDVRVVSTNPDDLAAFIQLCKLIGQLCGVGASRDIRVAVDGDGSGALKFDFGDSDVSDVQVPDIDDELVIGIGE
jgi:hypothetical protein